MFNVYLSISPVLTVLIWVGVLIVVNLIGGLLFLMYVAKRVFDGTLVREDKNTWGYECSCPEDSEQMKMWDEGVLWAENNKNKMREVDITSRDGLRLHAEFYDFGGENAVIFLPGRCECLRYSCYFAKPYSEMGFSVLAIDVRCHGKSDGKFSSVGKGEGEDVLLWAEYLVRECGIKNIWLHGICLGCAAAFVATTDANCPREVRGIVAEGPYVTFRETYKQHLIQKKKPVWPLVDLIMARIKRKTGVDYREVAPIRLAAKHDRHILYIFGEKDQFSLPPKSRQLFEVTKSATKKIVWLPEGTHSHLRVNNEKEYDNAIKEYIANEK